MKEIDMSNDNEYVRKPFEVVAERVTPLNLQRLAKWCGGKIHSDGEKEGNFSRDYIHVKVQDARTPEHERAKIGDWIVKSGRTWKVYNDKAFRRSFQKKDGSAVGYTDISGEAPAFKKGGPVPGPPKQLVGQRGPEIVNNSDGSVIVNGKTFVPAPPVPLATITPTDLGDNVEIPNADGSITVVPTPDPEVIADHNALQAAPIPEVAVDEKDITVDEQLVRDGNVEAILEGEGVVVGNNPVVATQAQAVDIHGNPVAMPAPPVGVPSPVDTGTVQAASVTDTDPVMTEVAPGVEVSDGAIHGSLNGELVDHDERTPGEVFRGEA
jgi:hypothetical protein